MRRIALVILVACAGPEAVQVARPAPPPRCESWRFAVVAGPFDATETVSRDDLAARWTRGDVAATPEAEAALAPLLGKRAPVPLADHPTFDGDHWGIVPVHALSPAWRVIAVDGHDPLDGLEASVCGQGPGFDPTKLTTLVMSGTTALTGAIAEHIDHAGIADTISDIAPFFTSADLDHVSNEVAFVHDCEPWTGQGKELKFCSRDRYIELLAALHVTIVELTGSHLLDYGHASLERTLDMYEKRGWVWYGGGRTQIEATAPRLIDDHGNHLAFVGCNHVNWWIDAIYTGSGGANCDYARMAWQIQDLRRRGYTVIASVQHRELLTHKPDWDLVADLRTLAEAGATFVEGSQAHTAHPWDVHHGAFVAYGPGNTLFAQARDIQREATIDKLYIYNGRLLTVAQLFIRSEHGRPRVMTDAERAHFMAEMAEAEAGMKPPDPWAPVKVIPETRERPDSLVARGKSQKVTITMPRDFRPNASYPLVVDLDNTAADDGAFVVRRKADILGKWLVATGPEIATFMEAKYPIDAAHVRITGTTPKPIVLASKPVAGLRWVRHRHHHELDYQIDANGNRVP